jgi:ethanolamine utilization cobalamin adenosyltransferase
LKRGAIITPSARDFAEGKNLIVVET